MRYVRITLDDGKRIILQNPRSAFIGKLNATCVIGTQVNAEGDTGNVERIHIIQQERIKRQTELVMSLHYGTLEAKK